LTTQSEKIGVDLQARAKREAKLMKSQQVLKITAWLNSPVPIGTTDTVTPEFIPGVSGYQTTTPRQVPSGTDGM
jgi:hypothetical protein